MVRYSYWKLLRDKGKEPYHLIARLNGRSHATIMNGITRLVNLLEVNDEKALSAWNLVKNIEYDNSSRF